MFANRALPIGILGLALWGCGDDGKTVIPIDAPSTPPVDAADPPPVDTAESPPVDAADPPIDAQDPPEIDAFVPPAPVNLAPNPDLELNADGWTTNAGSNPVLTRTTAVAHGGVASLLATTRAGNWNGPAVDVTARVVPGKRYVASVFVRLASDRTETFSVSTRLVCSEDNKQVFNRDTDRTSLTVEHDTSWIEPSSKFTVPAEGCTLASYLVYIETAGQPAPDTAMYVDFYLDDIAIVELEP